MKALFFGKKNICKKPKIPPRKKDISFDRHRKRINTEISEDEESSHVVGKYSDSGGGINDTLPPRQSCV